MKKNLVRILIAIFAIVAILVVNLLIFGKITSVVSEGERIEIKGTGNTALLVIDIQEGTTGSLSIDQCYIDRSEELISELNRLIEEAQANEWAIIYIGSEVVNPLINVLNNILARGSEGVEFDNRLAVQSDHIVIKRRNDAFHEEALNELLTELEIEEVILVGLDAAHCVYHTMQGALNRGYEVSVIEEALISESEEMKQNILETYRELGVEIR